MVQTFSIKEKIITYLKLFMPILITQIALVGGSFVAVFLTGQYSTEHLAGISIGFNIWIAVYTAILGVLYGLTPIISHLLGAKRTDEIARIIQHGFYLSTAFGILTILLGVLFLEPFISTMHLSSIAHDICIKYMITIGFAFIGLYWVCTMRNVVDSHGYTHISMTIIVSGFIINVIANYLLIFGKLGLPALGGIGAGWGVAISTWFNVLAYALVLSYHPVLKKYHLFKNWASFDLTYWKEQLHIGIPMGISIFCEMSVFSLATFAMAHYGTKIIAAHQAALSFTSMFYCFPLTISIAATILVAYETGASRYQDAREYSNIARIIALIGAVALATLGFSHIKIISSLYTNDASMIGLIANFLSYAFFFSIVDAFGAPVQGILRGYKDVKIITVIALSCYWGIGIPMAILFAYILGFGPYGIWIGMLTGISSGGLMYIWRLHQKEKIFKTYSMSQKKMNVTT